MDTAPAPGEPYWAPLPVPRPLTASEHALAAALVDAVDDARLRAQLAGVEVVGTCRQGCDCGSVVLSRPEPRLDPDTIRRLTNGARDDYLAVAARTAEHDGRWTTVTLHVVTGRLGELEIFATDGAPGALPAVADLVEIAVEPQDAGA